MKLLLLQSVLLTSIMAQTSDNSLVLLKELEAEFANEATNKTQCFRVHREVFEKQKEAIRLDIQDCKKKIIALNEKIGFDQEQSELAEQKDTALEGASKEAKNTKKEVAVDVTSDTVFNPIVTLKNGASKEAKNTKKEVTVDVTSDTVFNPIVPIVTLKNIATQLERNIEYRKRIDGIINTLNNQFESIQNNKNVLYTLYENTIYENTIQKSDPLKISTIKSGFLKLLKVYEKHICLIKESEDFMTKNEDLLLEILKILKSSKEKYSILKN